MPRRQPIAAHSPPETVPAGDRLFAKDIALRERCAPRTARTMMRRGCFGPVFGRNCRVRWVDRLGYERWLHQMAETAVRS